MLEPLMFLGACCLGAIAVFVFVSLRFAKKECGGFGVFGRWRMRRGGRRVRARVLDLVRYEGGIGDAAHHECHLVLDVTPAEGEVYRARMLVSWNPDKWDPVVPGRVLPLFVAPNDPQRLMVDFATIREERASAASEQSRSAT